MNDLTGQNLKGYVLKDRIGAGGFGAVYLAVQSTVGREVAVKVILPGLANQPDFIRRFESEAQIIARLEHMHITPLYDYWRDPEGAYIVMRYLRGGSLREMIDQNRLDVETVAHLLDQIGSALEVAHRNQVIHRDIKPSNILLDEDGNAYLADFGIAKDIGGGAETMTEANALIGSPDYLSPEQARSEAVTPQTDIYSLGVVLYEMLVGEHPFPGLTLIERLYKHINEPLPELNGLDIDRLDKINAVVQKATAKDPRQRYKSVLVLAQAFRSSAGLMGSSTPANQVVELLTPREQEILSLLMDGLSNREIAGNLVIEIATVKWYTNKIYKKLGVRSRVQAIVKAKDLNLLFDRGVKDKEFSTSYWSSLPEPENPYKGLRAFQTADVQDFFGREKLTQRLLDKLLEQVDYSRFLAVIGPSGSGKSSLVKAGVIPALWRGDLPGSDKWFITEMIPGAHPLDELEIALTQVSTRKTEALREHLERDKRGLVRATQLVLPDEEESELCLIIDQFEEIFTLVEDEAARNHFLNLIYTAITDPRSRVRVLVTLRADFYDRPLQHPQFGELVRSRMETVLPLSSSELERVISGPAGRVGVRFEEGLVAAIVDDVHYQPGALPLLQYALTELFEQREGRNLSLASYQQIGRAVGALAKRAEEIYLEQDEDGQAAVRQLFLRLVTLGEGVEDTRRRADRNELLSITENTELIEEILDTYANYRLLALDNDPATRRPTVEVAHEALLREWERLRAWLNDNRDNIRMQQQLGTVAESWKRNGKDNDFLLRGTRLNRYKIWGQETDITLTKLERAFLQASQALHEQEQADAVERQDREARLEKRSQRILQGLVAVFAVATIVSIFLTNFAFGQQDIAEEQVAVAETEAARAAAAEAETEVERIAAESARGDAEAQTVVAEREAELNLSLALAVQASDEYEAGHTELAMALIIEAINITDPPKLAQDIFRELASQPGSIQTLNLLPEGEVISGMDFSPDNKFLVIGTSDDNLILYDLAANKVLWKIRAVAKYRERFERPDLNGISVHFNPDGTLIETSIIYLDDATVDENGRFNPKIVQVRFYDVETGEFEFSLPGFASSEGVFSPDGQLYSNTDVVLKDEKFYWTLNIWDITRQSLIQEFLFSTERGNSVGGTAISPDNNIFVIFLDDDATIRFYDITTGGIIEEFNNLGVGGRLLKFSPDGKYLYMGGNGDPAVWSMAEKRFLSKPDAQSISGVGDISDSSKYYVYIDHDDTNWHLWNFESETIEQSFDNNAIGTAPNMISISSDDKLVAVSYDGMLRLFDMHNTFILNQWSYLGVGSWALGLSPDGSILAVGSDQGDITLWNTGTYELIKTITPPVASLANEVIFTPDQENLLISWGEWVVPTDQNIRVSSWDIDSGQETTIFDTELVLPDEGMYIPTASLNSEGTILATGVFANFTSDYGNVSIWDFETGNLIDTLYSGERDIFDIVFTPDGKYLVGQGNFAHYMWVWDAVTFDLLYEYEVSGHNGIMFGMAVHPDGERIITGGSDGSLYMRDIKTGEILFEYFDNPIPVFSMTISPDGEFLFIGGFGANIKTGLWDLESAELIQIFDEHDGPVVKALFASDGKTAYSIGFGGKVVHWQIAQLSLDDLITWVNENRVIREFTAAERAQFGIEP